jgi:hypothetical protein
MTSRITATMLSVVALFVLSASSASAIPSRPTIGDGAVGKSPGAIHVVQKSNDVEGGATGDGPADDAECGRRADQINGMLDNAQTPPSGGGHHGPPPGPDFRPMWQGMADMAMQEGLERGCFFMYGDGGNSHQ